MKRVFTLLPRAPPPESNLFPTLPIPLQVTFNAAARCLQQLPIEEIKALRGAAAVAKTAVNIASAVDLKVPAGVATMSESVVVFDLPAAAGTFGVTVGAPGTGPTPAGTPVGTSKSVHYYVYLLLFSVWHDSQLHRTPKK